MRKRKFTGENQNFHFGYADLGCLLDIQVEILSRKLDESRIQGKDQDGDINLGNISILIYKAMGLNK